MESILMSDITVQEEIEIDCEVTQKTRPQNFSDFIGQPKNIENLKIFIQAAKKSKRQMDHILFFGPPGLGKTTLAQIIANELNVNFRATSGPIISKAGDLAAILTNLTHGDILFIDEIHRLNKLVEEVLYPAMEDFKLDLIIGEGPAARSVRIDLPQFTLVGATTRYGMLSSPLRDRFGIPIRMEFYSICDLEKVVVRCAKILKFEIDQEAAHEIAKRSRGTPRIAGRLLRRIIDFATVAHSNIITFKIANTALYELEVDKFGLDFLDRKYLQSIYKFYKGGPVGIETLAAVLSENKGTIEDVIEPYLLQQGLLQRTSRGRVLTDSGSQYCFELDDK